MGGQGTWAVFPLLSVCLFWQAGAQTHGHCSAGGSGKAMRQAGLTEVGRRGNWHGPLRGAHGAECLP